MPLDVNVLFNSFTVVNRFLSRKLIQSWISHNSWALRKSTTISPDEYLFLAANTYDRTELIAETLSKNENFHKKKKKNGIFLIQESFSIPDPDERLDKLLGKVNDIHIKYDYDNPIYVPINFSNRNIKKVAVKGQLEKIIVRTLSNQKLAPNPYRKIERPQSISRLPSKSQITRKKSKPRPLEKAIKQRPLNLSKNSSVSGLSKANSYIRQRSINLSKNISVSALGLSVRDDPYHITTLREAALISFRNLQKKPLRLIPS